VTITIAPHPSLERHGDDLFQVRHISLTQAALGAVLTVETLDDPEELAVPPGTQPGHMFRLKGRGMPALRGRGRGDLLVRVDVEVPKRLQPEEAELLRRLAELRGDDVAPADEGFFTRLKSAFQ
jgi:molecular chaperone DnaJ